jgi:hypothetical protein
MLPWMLMLEELLYRDHVHPTQLGNLGSAAVAILEPLAVLICGSK